MFPVLVLAGFCRLTDLCFGGFVGFLSLWFLEFCGSAGIFWGACLLPLVGVDMTWRFDYFWSSCG